MKQFFKLIKSETEIDQIVETLFGAAHDAPVFYSAGMLQVWRNFTKKSMVLAVLFSDNQPVIALPLTKLKIWQNVSLDGWDNLDALRIKTITKEEECFFWQQLARTIGGIKLTEFTQISPLFLENVPVKFDVVLRRKCPYVALESNWESQNEKLSKKLVRNLRQYGNKAAAAGVTFRVFLASEISADLQREKLETAFSFHAKRMEDIDQKSKFSPTERANYHADVLQKAENAFVIEAQNEQKETVAFYYGLCNNHRLAWFNGGYSPEYVNLSIGTLLVSNLISYAMENGQQIFDFLRGNEAYKQKWTSTFDQNRDVYVRENSIAANVKWTIILFNDTRKRIGSKRAFLKIMLPAKNGND